MQGQYLRYSNTAPVIRLFAWSLTDGSPVTSLTNANTGLTTTRGLADTVHTLVSATLGTWVSNGFIHRGNGIYDWYAPITVNASGDDVVEVRASTLPAGATITPFAIALGADDLSAAAVTDASLTTAVWGAATRELSAISLPLRESIAAAVWAATTRELTGVAAAIREAFADSLLGRAIQGGANGSRTVTSALRVLRNRVQRVGTTLSVKTEDDTTDAWTATLGTDGTAAPIVTIDPN